MGGESIKPIRKRIHVYFLMTTYCVANNLKKQFPLWNNTRYQNESLNVKQRMDLLETIFNAEDLAIHLKYPYD